MSTPGDPLPPGAFLIGGANDPQDAADPTLSTLEHEVLSAGLRRTLDRSAELVARVRERHAADDDPAPAAAMEAVCDAPGASLVLRSLAERVRAGRVTWEQVWRRPGEHDGGVEVLAAVVRAIG